MSKSRHSKRHRRALALETRIRAVMDQKLAVALAAMLAQHQAEMQSLAVRAVQAAQRNRAISFR